MATVKKKKKKKMKTGDKVMLVISIFLFVIAFLILAGVAFLHSSPLSEGEPTNSFQTESAISHKIQTFLICGYDTDEESSSPVRRNRLADVIMVANYDISARKVNILQIPRDTYIDDKYPTGGTNKINAVTNQSVEKGGGITGLEAAVEEMLNLPIDHYVTITMDSFRDVVDALGGIEIDSPTAFTTISGIKIKEGVQLLNGKEAEAFVRERKNNGGDFGRQRSQRIFLSALMDRLLEASAGELTKMLPTLIQNVTTDMSLAELLDLAKEAQSLKKSNIVFHSSPGASDYYQVSSGQKLSVFSMNKELTANILNQYFRPYSDPVPAVELGIIQVFDEVTEEGGQESMDNVGESSTAD